MGAAAGRRQRVMEMAHGGAGGEDAVDAHLLDRAGQLGVQGCAVVAELQHVAERRELAALRRGEHAERCAHRGRVGIVAVVDQRDDAVRPLDPAPLAAPARRAEAGQCRGGALGIGAERRGGGDHRQAVAHPVAAGRADPEAEPPAIERHRDVAAVAHPCGHRAGGPMPPRSRRSRSPGRRRPPAPARAAGRNRRCRRSGPRCRRARGPERSRPWPRRSRRSNRRSRDGRARSW